MEGTIIKAIAGFYYVATVESGIYACRARGLFRKLGIRPLVGDRARIRVTDEQDKEASLNDILPRRNALIRPSVANVDQALLLFSLRSPDPESSLLDRFLVLMENRKIPVILCFNKTDLVQEKERCFWKERCEACGYTVFLLNAVKGEGVDALRSLLRGKTTVITGPSGAGKSTLINQLQDTVRMETGEISTKLNRGKNTTRHAELIPCGNHTFICDTPGFTSLDMPGIEAQNLDSCFPEFSSFRPECYFPDCAHMEETSCGVIRAVKEGKIAEDRYASYRRFYEELKEREKRRY
ncbi:MAG: ribosome small subunit-dependent GTPase A [Eubacterium sp.]|nr:ribosome small subunit-dependent GTPase A [Eubacterium sp.]